jgi:REP element-mobilizing transposase RayT
MAPTYPNVVIHCVFSTKDRWDSIPGELLERLRLYCVGIGKNHDIPVLSAGGTANHVHFLTALPATIALAKAVQILKANSSRWTRISEGSVPGTSVPGFHMPPLRVWSILPVRLLGAR